MEVRLSKPPPFVSPPPWTNENAVCYRTPDPDLWFPERGGASSEAKRRCKGCPLRAECLRYAFEHDEKYGIWGGLSALERTRLLRRVRKQAA